MGDSASDVATVREAFGETMDAWHRTWPFGFGPVMREAGTRADRLLARPPWLRGATDAEGAAHA